MYEIIQCLAKLKYQAEKTCSWGSKILQFFEILF
jgi:hypothetical protein